MRPDGRKNDQLRPLKIWRSYLKYPEGSVMIEMGDTKVICSASVENRVPPFLKGLGKGWITAEYSMLPRATETRTARDVGRGQVNGRSQEIQRLIGRSLRAVADLEALGEYTIWLDCDVIQADGGTRVAAVTGSFVALAEAFLFLRREGKIARPLLRDYLAAISVGLAGEEPLLDLCFAEDASASVDLNLVMTGAGDLVEVQGTAEGSPFSRAQMDHLLDLGARGMQQIILEQKKALGEEAAKAVAAQPEQPPWRPGR